MDNYDRGLLGKHAIQAGVVDLEQLGKVEQITDLLANVMHYCNFEKIDFNLALQNAQVHFEAEKES